MHIKSSVCFELRQNHFLSKFPLLDSNLNKYAKQTGWMS